MLSDLIMIQIKIFIFVLMDYSEKIRNQRKKRGFSQAEVAKIIGISQAAYGKIESGFTKSITIEVGKGIAKALNIPFGELFEIEGIGSDLLELEKQINQLKEKIKSLENQITDKELIIEMFKSEKERIRKDMLHYLEEIYDTSILFLKDMKDSVGLSDSQIKEIQHNVINLIITISTSYFMGRGLIKEEDYDKVTGKYFGIVRPADPSKENID
jgi:transcriptional regulator with XRE-family HTH domain